MKSKKVGIIGCGKIFPRHLEAIQGNPDYELVGVCDVDKELVEKRHIETGAKAFVDYRQMVDSGEVNFVVVATPNSQHFEQAKYALMNQCDALIEKPATINPMQIEILKNIADECHQRVYAVLQVRLNSCIQSLKHLVDNKIIGEIRGVGLIQRWQRPLEYFSDWRGSPLVGGGTLHECGIHYLDILCYILGKPEVVASKKYNTKHKSTSIEDTVYATLDYGSFGGNVEVSISAEPSNIECSLTILTDIGYIRLGGRAMNVVEKVDFLSEDKTRQVKKILEKNNSIGTPNSYGSYAGSCPNHPNLYKNIHNFDLLNTSDVLNLIDEIYANCGIKYY